MWAFLSMANASITAIILAAGKGTRMKSDLPKGLHEVCGVPMVELVGRAVKEIGVEKPIVVVGHGGDQIQAKLGASYDYAWQHEQKGTGHAVQMAAHLLENLNGTVLVVPGDAPLLSSETLQNIVRVHEEAGASCTVATAFVQDPTGYGRVVTSESGECLAIVEHKDATPEQKKIQNVNTSLYCFNSSDLLEGLPHLSNNNSQGEFYLTDMITYLRSVSKKVVAAPIEEEGALVGVNDRWQLAEASKQLRLILLKKIALSGVTIIDPDSVFIGPDVEIGHNTTIHPNVYLEGKVTIGSDCEIGPATRITASQIGNGTTILFCNIAESKLGNNVWCGPYCNLRPETVLGDGVKLGDFVEIKKSTLATGVKVPHLTYVGDAEIGAHTNIGAGAIVANYDGFTKHHTTIGEDVFVGTGVTLVAPVNIGDRALLTAGSVITKDVPADSAGFGRARQENKDGWASDYRRKKQSKTN